MTRIFSFFLLLCLSCAGFAEEAAPPSVIYWEMKPSFVANYGSDGKKLHFVKADVSLRLSSEQAVAQVEVHQAMVRHEIVMLLSRQTDQDLARPDGQESLRKQALKLAQTVMEKETGSPQIEDLLFTNFVTQR